MSYAEILAEARNAKKQIKQTSYKQQYNPPLFASVSNYSATRRSVAFELFDAFSEVPLLAITVSPGTCGTTQLF